MNELQPHDFNTWQHTVSCFSFFKYYSLFVKHMITRKAGARTFVIFMWIHILTHTVKHTANTYKLKLTSLYESTYWLSHFKYLCKARTLRLLPLLSTKFKASNYFCKTYLRVSMNVCVALWIQMEYTAVWCFEA